MQELIIFVYRFERFRCLESKTTNTVTVFFRFFFLLFFNLFNCFFFYIVYFFWSYVICIHHNPCSIHISYLYMYMTQKVKTFLNFKTILVQELSEQKRNSTCIPYLAGKKWQSSTPWNNQKLITSTCSNQLLYVYAKKMKEK